MDTPAPRIVSLLPAATEIVAALGLGRSLVGRSHECDWPPGVEAVPCLTRPRIDPAASSRAIHEAVGRGLADRGTSRSLFELDVGRLLELRPDVILTQAACDVCAIAAADVEEAVCRSGRPVRIVALAPASLDDLWHDILTVADAAGALPQGRDLVGRLRGRVRSIACRTAVLARRDGWRPPRVAVVEWLDPPMAAGNWSPELVRLAGGEDPLGRPGRHSHWIQWADLAAIDPDVVVLVPCGFPLARVVAEAGSAAVRSHLAPLRARREGRVHAVDGHHLFNRPGPRLVDSLEALAELLHPSDFRFAVTSRFTVRLSG